MSTIWKLQDMEHLFKVSNCPLNRVTRDHNTWGFHLTIGRFTPVSDADTQLWAQQVCQVLDDAGIPYKVRKVRIHRERASVQEGIFYHEVVLDIPEVI